MDTNVDVIEILQSAAIFRGLDEKELALIQSISQTVVFNVADMIFKQGSSSSELYVVVNGEVDILVDQSLVSEQTDQGMLTIATMRRGEAFGEIALVDDGNRSAAAKSALPETSLVVIPQDVLIRLCEDKPMLGYRLMRNLAQDLALTIRTRTTDMQIREWLTWSRGHPPA